MAAKYRLQSMGWLPDFPDFRDRTPEHAAVEPLVARTTMAKPTSLPAAVDLSPWCSPVENQGALASCTANAAVGLYEYFERRAKGEYVDGSRLFVYKTSRNLLRWTGDSGSFIRTAMGALVLFGVPPEDYWPYDPAQLDTEPPAFCYAFAENFTRGAVRATRSDRHGARRRAGTREDLSRAQVPRDVRLHRLLVDRSRGCRRQDPDPGGRREGRRRARCDGGRVRRRDSDHESGFGRVDHGRAEDPEFVGAGVGRWRLRLASVRLSHRGTRPATGGR